MAWRRVLYLIFLAASFLYYVFYTWYVSWIVFIFALLLPILSVLLTLILMRGCRVVMECGVHQAEQGEGFDLFFHIEEPNQPMAMTRIKLMVENLFSGKREGYEIYLATEKSYSLHIDGELCGVIRSSISCAHIMDLLGILWLPVRAAQSVETLLTPEKIPFAGKLDPLTEHVGEDMPYAGGEWQDVREYRDGDPLRMIHWKLSARKGETVVREYAKVSETRCVGAALIWNGNPHALHRSLGRLFGVLDAFEMEGYRFRVLWIEQGEIRTIAEREELEEVLWQALRDASGADRLLSTGVPAARSFYEETSVIFVSPDAASPIGLSELMGVYG